MGIGSFAMACLLLAVAAGGTPDEWHMNQTQFKIPIRIKPELQTDISELKLFCSRDEGKTWNLAGVAKPSQDGFLFNTNGEGKYWFSVAVVNHKGVQDPLDLLSAPVGQKIILDVTKPDIRVVADRQGEEVAVVWEINELYPRPETLKVEYRAADAPESAWTAVTVAGNQTRTAFKPVGPTNVVVRVQLEDQAGNVGSGQATVGSTAPVVPVVQTTPATPLTPVPAMTPTPTPTLPVAAPPVVPSLPVVANPAPLPGNNVSSWNTTPSGNPTPIARSADVTPVAAQTAPPVQSFPGVPGATLATSGHNGAGLIRGQLPPLQIVNKSQVKLDYEVAKLGPSGVGSVDVYVTTDEGQTWGMVRGLEAVAGMPVSDPRAPTVKGGVLVHLDKDDVIYGFYMIVKSGAGLGKAPPKNGDYPQIRIERDTTPPLARLLRPLADANRPDTLLLAWEASDKNLANNPVTLEWAAGKDGPWQYIGGPELPNTGRFTWTVPANIPPSVYLRLTVRDTAGNTAVAQTDQPELVDLSVPEVKIIGVGNSIR